MLFVHPQRLFLECIKGFPEAAIQLPKFLSFVTVNILVFLLVPNTADSSDTLERFEYSQMAMGVRARIVVYARDQSAAEQACRAAFDRITFLDSVMSDYRQDSELIKLCANAGGTPTKVSRELLSLIIRCQYLAKLSDGSFDITVGPLVKLWRQARKSGQLPADAQIAKAKSLVGWQKLSIDRTRCTVRLELPGMQLDLGGIAKGYACDEAIRVLKDHGIDTALVEMGGDIVVSGPPPGKEGWEIELANLGGSFEKRLLLAHAAVSSSGDTEQFVEIEGRRYSHIVDPKTGLGLTNRMAVTVIGPSGTLCDGLSTTLSVMDERQGRALVDKFPGVRAYLRKLE
ncbi:MAG: FAD:protein FMN transferase [Armatimonadetes bacterium]|nr:FAD:protein FMN transferase [Armatimonadota bacterium]